MPCSGLSLSWGRFPCIGIMITIRWTSRLEGLSARCLSSLPKSEPTQTLKEYEAIPSLPKGLPFIGNLYLMAKKPNGVEYVTDNVKELFAKYDPDGVGILRAHAPMQNRKGQGRFLLLSRPDDFEVVFRHEGKYPTRGTLFDSMKKWRDSRPDIFENTTGLIVTDGEEWKRTRSLVNQDMMRSKAALSYAPQIETVAKEFLDHLEKNLSEKRETPDGTLMRLHDYAFEAISLVALDTRMGAFNPNPDPEIIEITESVRSALGSIAEMFVKFPWWRISQHLSPSYQTMTRNLEVFSKYAKSKIVEAKARIEARSEENTLAGTEISVLEKLILKSYPDVRVPVVMALDMIMAGTDTTGNTAAFLLYLLATHPEKQEILRNEILHASHPQDGAQTSFGSMRYLKAVIKEALRLYPIAIGNSRVIPEEIDLRGFRVPALTHCHILLELVNRNPQFFTNPEDFLPERWLRGNNHPIHPFATLPFGHGPRMCIGKRFAELELQILVCQFLQRYQIEWAGNGPLTYKWRLINTPIQEIRLRLNKLPSLRN